MWPYEIIFEVRVKVVVKTVPDFNSNLSVFYHSGCNKLCRSIRNTQIYTQRVKARIYCCFQGTWHQMIGSGGGIRTSYLYRLDLLFTSGNTKWCRERRWKNVQWYSFKRLKEFCKRANSFDLHANACEFCGYTQKYRWNCGCSYTCRQKSAYGPVIQIAQATNPA